MIRTIYYFILTFSIAILLTLSGSVSLAQGTVWAPLKIGGGGNVTGIDVSSNGSVQVVRTDTAGAYIRSGMQWQQLVTAQSMPSGSVAPLVGRGVYEIRVAPNNTSVLYMAFYKGIYRSTNGGQTWAQTSFSFPATSTSFVVNDGYGYFGQKMAIDPNNANVVYVGTAANGLYVTTNGGGSWSPVSSIPASLRFTGNFVMQGGAGAPPGVNGIVFDPNSGTTNGMTNTIYVSSYGNGVYRSGNAGQSWTLLTSANGPATGSVHAKIATSSAGSVYYATGNNGYVWRLASGIWTNITPAGAPPEFDNLAVDPMNFNHIVAGAFGNERHYLCQHKRWQHLVVTGR